MYQVNLQSITERSPEINNQLINGSKPNLKMQYRKHFSRLSALITSLLLIGFFTGCQESGSVGGAIEDPEDRVITTEVEITNITVLSDNGYSGRLLNSAAGYVEDPLFGTIESATLLKPSISQSDIEEITSESEVRLRLVLNPEQYGVDTRVNYNVYEVGEIWRGRQLQYNTPVTLSNILVGSFSARNENTVDVQLSASWVQNFRQRFNSESADRDSTYRYQFPGLAIVPEGQNQRTHFFRYQQAEDDTLGVGVTRLIVENQDEELSGELPMLDWATTMTRQNVPDSNDSFILDNTLENLLKLELDLDSGQFKNQQIVNVQLVFHEHESITMQGNFERPLVNSIRAHAFATEPESIINDIFTRQAFFVSTRSEDGIYKLNATDFVLSHLFGEDETPTLYFSAQSNNGIFYSTKLYNHNGPANKTPRLVITSIKPEE